MHPFSHSCGSLLFFLLSQVLEETFIFSSLAEPDLQRWTIETIESVYHIVESSLQAGVVLPEVLPPTLTQGAVKGQSTDSPDNGQKMATVGKAASLLAAVHAGMLSPSDGTASTVLPADCLAPLHRVAVGVCRLPLPYPYAVVAPEAYRLGWDNPGSGFIPDRILVERDVLTEINKQAWL